jgi:DNA-binding MarR family transcriptional regulator
MTDLEILKFIPFRLNRLAAEVSDKLAEVYTDRFGIDVVEWRILVTLAAQEPCSAQTIVRSTRTHKSRISRGVNRMIELKLVARTDNVDDRRETRLRLTARGRKLHGRMVPVVLAQEQNIVSCLSRQELDSFTHAMDKLERSLTLVQHRDAMHE